jgi:hypothetical protein
LIHPLQIMILTHTCMYCCGRVGRCNFTTTEKLPWECIRFLGYQSCPVFLHILFRSFARAAKVLAGWVYHFKCSSKHHILGIYIYILATFNQSHINRLHNDDMHSFISCFNNGLNCSAYIYLVMHHIANSLSQPHIVIYVYSHSDHMAVYWSAISPNKFSAQNNPLSESHVLTQKSVYGTCHYNACMWTHLHILLQQCQYGKYTHHIIYISAWSSESEHHKSTHAQRTSYTTSLLFQ